MTSEAPTYSIVDDTHHFTFPDGTSLDVIAPARDRFNRLSAEVRARAGTDHLLMRARFDLLSLRDQERFCAAVSSVDGTVNWRPRLVFATEHVGAAMAEKAEEEASHDRVHLRKGDKREKGMT